jgi:hypothetical protein
MQWYFREINFENIYAESIKKEEIMNSWLEGFKVYL